MQEGREVCDAGRAVVENGGPDEGPGDCELFIESERHDATSADTKWYEDPPTSPRVKNASLKKVSWT